jgi:hypothetical protein
LQLGLQDKFRDAGLYYERQEGSFEALSDEDLEEMDLEAQSKAIQIRKLAQTFLASQGEIDKMSRLTDVFESDKAYSEAFRESYLNSDCRRIVLAYKIQFRLRNIVREIVEKGASKYAFLHRARNLVWALLIQGVLNDQKRDWHLEAYGASLTMEADYTELLRKLASTRVRLAIADAIGDERSRALLAAENYGFLRTRAVFLRCMEAASDRWQWKKLPL